MRIYNLLKKMLGNDELMFKVSIGLKFVSITVFFLVLLLAFTSVIVNIDLNYFNSKGFPEAIVFNDAFFEYIYGSINEKLLEFLLIISIVFIIGYYVAVIMIRPFRVIARFCEDKISNHSAKYTPDMFSDLKLLTSFTTFFFSRIDDARNTGTLEKVVIPEEFTKIHKPVFEKNFFYNYFFLITAFSLLASIGIFMINFDIHEKILLLGKHILKSGGSREIIIFLNSQFEIIKIINIFLIVFHIFLYCAFGLHLYGMVSTPSFAIFATMRSFLKGNTHSRIHLVGYSYLRNDCRIINKYLDHIQKSVVKK